LAPIFGHYCLRYGVHVGTIAGIARVFARTHGGKMASNVETSLYKRIGGYDVIAAFTDH
jgi:hypothetical protein